MLEVEIRIADEFVADTAQIYSERVFEAVYDAIDKLKFVPELGSANVPASVRERYGNRARRIVVSTFDIFYTYDESAGIIEVKALVHQRRVH